MAPVSDTLRSVWPFWTPLWARLGSCLYCTRSAFRAAILAWSVSGFFQVVGAPDRLQVLFSIGACSLTGLWLAHLIAHALKASARADMATNEGRVSRRAIFVRALASAAVVTATPRLAFGQCSNESEARCHSAELECHASCDRLFHRDERNRACHQECLSDSTECRSRCG
jgi:hypothetical protein